MRYFLSWLVGLFLAGTAAAAVSSSLQFNQPLSAGSPVLVSGNCDTNSAGGYVAFTLQQGQTSTVLGAVGNRVQSDGSFAASVGIPGFTPGGASVILANCPNGQSISSSVSISPSTVLPDGSAIKGSGLTVYVIFGGRKYGIPTLDRFYSLGLTLQDIIIVKDSDIATYPDGGVF